MNRVIVESSQIESIGYKIDSETLEIEFKGGAVYEYYKIPPALHVKLMSAESKGSFFFKNIKLNKEIEYKKIRDKQAVAAA